MTESRVPDSYSATVTSPEYELLFTDEFDDDCLNELTCVTVLVNVAGGITGLALATGVLPVPCNR